MSKEKTPVVQDVAAAEATQVDPRAFGYRQGGMISMPAEIFEILRGFLAEEAMKRQPKKMFLHQKPVIAKNAAGKNEIAWVDIETDEEYKNQKAIEFRDTDSFNYVYVNNLLEDTHFKNIENGNAVPIDVLKKELQEAQESRLKKVEE